MKPNYDNSLVSVTNSILKYYGAKTHHPTLFEVDNLLSKNYKNVVLLVIDGMGINVLERNLSQNAFLRQHINLEISSVFPPTTTAATTSILTGQTPAEHGWIGWSCYFKEVDKCIDLFSNHESGTENPASDEHQPYKLMPYETIHSKIDKATNGKIKTCFVSPFSEFFANTMGGICEQIKMLCETDEQKFVYAYHVQLDHDMHDFGVSPDCIMQLMKSYDEQISNLANSLKDTLLLITADHGMTDITMKKIEYYPELEKMLKRHICVESRCCSFYIKDEYKTEFPILFDKTFGDKFVMYTHDEFIKSGLLGKGKHHKKVDDFIGDYVAIAVSDFAIWYNDINGKFNDFNGAHAGLSKDELTIPLIVVEK